MRTDIVGRSDLAAMKAAERIRDITMSISPISGGTSNHAAITGPRDPAGANATHTKQPAELAFELDAGRDQDSNGVSSLALAGPPSAAKAQEIYAQTMSKA